MQGILERVPVKGFGHPAWDFVEVPSMIMQNFIQERAVLDLFARHYQTGERLPDSLYSAMNRARNFRAAAAQMGQLSLGTVDILMHTEYQGDTDLVEYARNIQQRFTGRCWERIQLRSRASLTSLQAANAQLAITPTNGPRSLRPMPSRASRRKAF